MFFAAEHRKLYQIASDAPVPLPMEDQTLTSMLHPDSELWRINSAGASLYVAAGSRCRRASGRGNRFGDSCNP